MKRMNTRTMKNLIVYRSLLLFIMLLSSISIVILLCLNRGTMEYILSIISIAVTCILGIVTYQQVDTQLKMDMVDKTPFLNCEFETEKIFDDKGANDIIRNENLLFANKRYLIVESLADSLKEALFHLQIKNCSPVFIKKVDVLYKEQDLKCYVPVDNYRAKKCALENPEAEFLKKLSNDYCGSSIYGMTPDTVADIYIKVPFNCQEVEAHIKLDIETVHGYQYEEVMDIYATKIGVIEKKGLIYLITKCEMSVLNV